MKHKLIKNFISKEELELGTHYYHLSHKKNNNEFDPENNNCDGIFYSDTFSETLLMKKLKFMEKETSLKLFPTYSFTRFYTYNSELKKHVDRPSCEISVSIMWDSDGTKWPLYIDGSPVEMERGDGVIYSGCDYAHWREPFEGDFHVQTFLHYVNANGVNKEYKYDKRSFNNNPEILWK